MRIFKCRVSGDELFTDAKKVEEFNGFYKVMGKNVTRSGGIDDALIGGNASQEEAAEGTEDGAASGIDLVLDQNYQTTAFGKKKDYLVYMKDYLKELMKVLEIVADSDEEKQFKADIKIPFSQAQEWFKDLDFYTGSSMNPEGMVILTHWEAPPEGGDDVPFFYYYKAGVIDEKV